MDKLGAAKSKAGNKKKFKNFYINYFSFISRTNRIIENSCKSLTRKNVVSHYIIMKKNSKTFFHSN